MKRDFHTPKGIEYREPTPGEFAQMLKMGDTEAVREDAKNRLEKAKTSDEKITILTEAFLGVK